MRLINGTRKFLHKMLLIVVLPSQEHEKNIIINLNLFSDIYRKLSFSVCNKVPFAATIRRSKTIWRTEQLPEIATADPTGG